MGVHARTKRARAHERSVCAAANRKRDKIITIWKKLNREYNKMIQMWHDSFHIATCPAKLQTQYYKN